ncbi:MAG: Lrp/AsnC family transcriptional regulator [Candidatus Aenigmatarchaeota archaeon]|nr:MAG: Lrp/AsnC family transcriptional regulator [Candidatus Aenigmarchaeota archaeon]
MSKNNYKLDLRDWKILYELDRNSRQSNSEIGKKVRLSKEVVKYRIDRMLESGVIIKFHTISNYFKLGIYKHKLYLRLKDIDKKKLDEIGQYFIEQRNTEWVVTCTGRWDMIVGFLVKNVNEFDVGIQNMMNKFSSHIQEKAVTTTLHLVHHLREYLSQSESKERKPLVYHTSADPREKIDNMDREILKILANNARMSVREIAERLKTTPRTVQYRMKRMEKSGVILAYKVLLDPKKMGNVFCKAIIYLTSSTKEKIDHFVNYCSSLPQAVWPQRVMGTWDFELDFEIESYDRFQDIMFEIKEKFSDIMQKYEFAIVSKEFKLDFFPDAYPLMWKA